MRHLFIIFAVAFISSNQIHAQNLNPEKVKFYESELVDVMELMDTAIVKAKLTETEQAFKNSPTEINSTRLGIIYHEAALNLSFLSQGNYKGYAQKSFDILDQLYRSEKTAQELLPFVASYRASALALVSAETKKLKLLDIAFKDFQIAVDKYGSVSYCPEFLRGSVAENLPKIFFIKRKFAKHDFQSIIDKQLKDNDFANWKIMSFTYWAWANQHRSNKHRKQAIAYLDKAIELDSNYEAGRKRAEMLKAELTQ